MRVAPEFASANLIDFSNLAPSKTFCSSSSVSSRGSRMTSSSIARPRRLIDLQKQKEMNELKMKNLQIEKELELAALETDEEVCFSSDSDHGE
jgi:hypothetical protein